MNPKLTIGMACFDDRKGVAFTVNALRLYQDIADVELIVVDNSPDTPQGKATARTVASCGQGFANALYIPMPEAVGTSAPRNRIFQEATGDAIMCLDCHVLLFPDVVRRLKNWYDSNPETMDLYSGPLVFDNFGGLATHYTPRWRDTMEGTWGWAWQCKCGAMIDVVDIPEHERTKYRPLMGLGEWQDDYHCECGNVAPALPWPQHEEKLVGSGFHPCGTQPNDKPFEIPGQGLGLFTCRKEAWLGFNSNFRGFGGEELYIHRKYRQAGHKAVCLPWLSWWHLFDHIPGEGKMYNNEHYSRVRNYVLGHQETGMDITPIKEHFVDTKILPEKAWEHLLADPVKNETAPPEPICDTCNKSGQSLPVSEAELPVKDRQRFVELAKQHKRVVILGKRDWWKGVIGEANPENLHFLPITENIPEIEECDLLIIHSVHHADRLYAELDKLAPKVMQRILLRSTHAFGEQAEGGGPGLLAGLRKYLRGHTEWTVIEHSKDNWGYTIISRDPTDKKPLPSIGARAWNFAQHLKDHVVDGVKAASTEVAEARLAICDLCQLRNGDHCGMCGCPISKKVAWASSFCDAGNWQAVSESADNIASENQEKMS